MSNKLKSRSEVAQEIAGLLALSLDSTDFQRLISAVVYAREAHDSVEHKRKYTGDPYWVHTEAVALNCAKHGGDLDEVIGCLLHDVLEDVWPKNPKYSPQSIYHNFEERVHSIVIGLTEAYTKKAFPDWNRAKRKLAEASRLGQTSSSVKLGKACDMIDNTSDIVKNDRKFAITYVKEKIVIALELIGGKHSLRENARDSLLESLFAAAEELKIDIPDELLKFKK